VVKICAAIAWSDEPVEFLTRCVSSLAGVCDELVAVDGAWKLFDAGPMSSPEQEEAIWRAARDFGLPVRVLLPSRIWESQVEKRARLMELASEHADWILVIDADEYIAHADGDAVHQALDDTELDVAFVTHRNLHNGWTADNPDPPRAGMNRRLYRAGTTVVVVHSGYVRDGEHLHVADAVDLRDALTIEHDNWNRGDERNQLAKDYRRARETERVEVWL
jgi:hypothetical protein